MFWRKFFNALTRIGGLALATVTAVAGFSVWQDFIPKPGAFQANLYGLGLPVFAAFVAACLLLSSLGAKDWSTLAWGSRVPIPLLGYAGYRYYAFATWREALAMAAAIAFFLT